MGTKARKFDARPAAHEREPAKLARGVGRSQTILRRERLVRHDPRELTPEQVLRLQAIAGNTSVAAALGRIGSADTRRTVDTASSHTPLHLQRKTYLANRDDAIYADTAHPGLELSYLDKTQERSSWLPLFIEYDRVTRIKDEVKRSYRENSREAAEATKHPVRKRQARRGVEKPRNASRKKTDLSNYVKQYFKFLRYAGDAVYELLGTVYKENVDGTLSTGRPNLMSATRAATSVALSGPLVRPEGGGSRLPRAAGKLFSRTATESDAYEFLGIPENARSAYSNVEFHCARRAYDALLRSYIDEHANVVVFEDLFYVSEVMVNRSRNARFQADDHSYDQGFSRVIDPSDEKRMLDSSYSRLKPPSTRGWQTGRELGKANREDGQVKAMGGWNALGVAAYANRFHRMGLPLNQNWEWLHIQGAQIGGVTAAGNLTPGLYTANSAMIPFERLVKRLAERGPDRMSVRFVPTHAVGPFARRIRIEIAGDGHEILGTVLRGDPYYVEFDPLAGRVVDKLHGKFLERQLDHQPKID